MGGRETVIIIAICIVLLLVILVIFLFVVFVIRKNALLKEKNALNRLLKTELSKSQIEIKEETLRNVAWELHDNIGQLVTLAKINAQLSIDNPEKISDVINIISQALSEIKSLSKSTNPDYLRKLGLYDSVKLELDRYNRIGYLNCTLQEEGTSYSLSQREEIIIFRIFQEFFINTIKHSKASELIVRFFWNENQLLISAHDNGIGFDIKKDTKGQGLENMKNRAFLIGAKLDIGSVSDQGTYITLEHYFDSPAHEQDMLSLEINKIK